MSSETSGVHEAVFRFRPERPGLIYEAVLPELEDIGRSCAALALDDDGGLTLTISGEDVPALRAALNTYLRLVMIAEEMQEVIIT
jgi:KEOPS complex subunit Pcc1